MAPLSAMVNLMEPKKAQKLQDEIFRKMPFAKKFHLGSDMAMFGLKLKQMNKNFKYPKTTFENIILSYLLCDKKEKRNNHSTEVEKMFKISRGILHPNFLKKQAAKIDAYDLLKKFLK